MQLELTFGNDTKHLPSVRAFLHTTLRQLPLAAAVADRLEAFVGGAVQSAIDHAYPLGDEGLIKLAIEEQHGKLEIHVRDFGLPQDVASLERQLHEPGAVATNRFGCPAADVVDEVHWLAFGPEGKALQVVKWLHETHIADAASAKSLSSFADDVPLAPSAMLSPRQRREHATYQAGHAYAAAPRKHATQPQEYTIRRMRAGEAAQVSQLMYRTYGNTYFNADVYYPDRVAAQNARDVVLSYVAVGAEGAVAGHYALERNQPGPVAEGGQAVVDPAHRGRGLLDRMKDFSMEDAKRLDLVGWYADAVSVHTLTQKSNAAHGGHLTAADLAIAPRTEKFAIASSQQPQRVTCLLYFHWLKPPAARTVYVPERHQAIVQEIYDRLGCQVEFGSASVRKCTTGSASVENRATGPASAEQGATGSASALSPAHGTLAVRIDAGAALANVRAETIGGDTVRLIRQARRELVECTHVEAVYVELPLDEPATASVAEQLEQDGFGFIGVAPHFTTRGDLLRLAYLVEPLAREPIQTFDETAARLVDYVFAEQTRLKAAL